MYRPFFLIDDRDRMMTGKHFNSLHTVIADWDEDEGRLTLSFPDQEPVSATVTSGANVSARFFSSTASGEVLRGPWSDALSSYLGDHVRLVRVLPAVIGARLWTAATTGPYR